MDIDFAPSARGTIGLEWELALVDPDDGGLVQRADEVLDALRLPDGSPHPHITGELLQNTVELVSGVHTTAGGAIDDLRHQLDEVRAVAAPRGIDLISSGSHPFGQWFEQPISDKQRYHKLIDRTQWWGRNMMIWGVHVHVGVDSVDRVLPLLDGLLTLSPHLQALTASSPFWAGVDTGYASNRALMFQQLPTAGLPQQFRAWSEFERYVTDMTRTGVIDDCTEVRWDLRPAPRWGTLEMRSCDATSTVDEFAAVAALIHCLVEHLNRELDAGRPLVTLPRWFVSENKWRAARYGLDAELIVSADGDERLVTDDLELWLDRLAGIAGDLGCARELAFVADIARRGGSYQRQRANATASAGDLSAVVAALARELREGLGTR
ncbi:glutamate--cysteine ligase [Mycetocola reblochoni]|uniref:Putative glutamate--cysteine ligase 2 n=2 Tax=Mycetocola reblochoni TaxID=331618 RepID=A0A1R4JBP0_9MICO|nr:glutamate--cysteine ligase [Mycetocola reblochoni]RLP69996.1 glutamate--cysteine ligase [Mycetocola reblochoni]SJN29442.1 Carboxylate-amine ligase [Mycetocola reblochoni REB411]